MKRLPVSTRLLPLAAIALLLALASCRSPVQGRAEGSLSLSLSIPADLSSDVPEPIRRAIGEAELAGSRPRFIHPDGKTVKASVTKADGSEVGSATASLDAGASSATLGIADLPLNEPLTLTVGVYDASNAKVGERVVEKIIINEERTQNEQVISMLPYNASKILLGKKLVTGGSDPVLSLESIDDRLYVYAVELPARGLYKALLHHDDSMHPFQIYDEEGLKVEDYVTDNKRSGFGLFTNDASEPVLYYTLFRGGSSWGSTHLFVHPEAEASMVQIGRSNTEPEGDALLPAEVKFLGVADGEGNSVEKTIKLKSIINKELHISSLSFTGDDKDSFSIPTAPATPIPPNGIIEFVIRFTNGKGYSISNATLTLDFSDNETIDFSMSVSGTESSS